MAVAVSRDDELIAVEFAESVDMLFDNDAAEEVADEEIGMVELAGSIEALAVEFADELVA